MLEFDFARQARAARRLRLRHQGRRPHQGVRLVGHVLRHLQARTAARLVRRRQVAVGTTTRSTQPTGRRCRKLRAARRRALARSSAGHRLRPIRSGDRLPSTVASAPTRSSRTSSRCSSRKRPLGVEHQLNDVDRRSSVRYVHKQIDRAIEDTRLRSTRAAAKDLHHRQSRAKGSRPSRSAGRQRCPTAEARLRQRRVRVREALRQPLVPPRRAICGAACSATTRASRSRTKTAAPARTSAACSTTR